MAALLHVPAVREVRTLEASAFVRGVADRLHSDEFHAEAIIRLVFQEMQDGLTEARASNVATHLPEAVQPLWSQSERLPRRAEEPYQLELLGTVMESGALADSGEAERAIVAVFATLLDLLDQVTDTTGAVRDVLGELPRDLEILWAAAERGRTASLPPRRVDPLIAPPRTRATVRSSAA